MCHSTTTSREIRTIPDPQPGFYDVQVSGYSDYADYRLWGHLTSAP